MAAASLDMLHDLKVPIAIGAIETFCKKWHVIELALFGSVLREDFRPDSDVDVLVTFDPVARPTLLTLIRMRGELERQLGRKVDLLERGGMNLAPIRVRSAVLASLRVLYAQ